MNDRMLSKIEWCSWLGALLVSVVLLQPCSSAECDAGSTSISSDDSVITLVLYPRFDITVTIPRVETLEVIVNSTEIDLTQTQDCDSTRSTASSCIIDVDDSRNMATILFKNGEDRGDPSNIAQTLNIIFDDTIEVWCRNYTYHNYTEGGNFAFTCEPVFTSNMNNAPTTDEYSIVWRYFNNAAELNNFKTSKRGYEANILTNSTDQISLMDSGCVTNATLLISGANRGDVGYYIPSVVVENMPGEMPVNETILYYHTTVTNAEEYEFSITVSQGRAEVEPLIFCQVDAFPPPTISWSLKNNADSDPRNVENSSRIFISDVIMVESSVGVGPNITYRMELNITNAQYSDNGIYHCIADNQVIKSEMDIVRLRVKDPLRALWPALGTIGVLIVVAIIIIVGTGFEKLWENITENRDKTGGHHKRLFSVTSATEPENDVAPQRISRVEPTDISPVKRVPSSRVQLLEESATTI